MVASSVYGLIQTDPRKKFTLQTAINPEDDDDQSDLALPTANFSSVPTIATPTGSAIRSNATVHAANIPANFQFTGAYEAANRALAQQESDAALARRNNITSVDQQYRDALARSGDLASIARTQLQENLASRGLATSGINAQAVGQQEGEYNYQLGELGKARANALSGIEANYADVLNQLYRQRESLFGQQQKDEEDRRLQEERLKAEAEAKRVQAEQQAQMIAAMRQQAEAAARAAAAAAAASQIPSYSPPSLGFGAGGGGAGYSPPQQQGNGNIVLPRFQSEQQARGWVRDTLDRNASDQAVSQVINYLMRAGSNGLPLADLAWLIQQYPNSQPVSKSDVGGKVYGGRFF